MKERRGSVVFIRVLILILCGGVVPATAGECPQASSDITTDRPSITNSSTVVPAGSLQSENGVNLFGQNGATVLDGTNSRLRYGVAPCLEVLVDLPNYFAPSHGSANAGFSDVAPALKWQISPDTGKFDLSVTFGAGLPTGAQRISGPGVQPYLQFPWSRDLEGGWSIAGMGSFYFHPSDPSSDLTTEATFLVQKKITDRASLFVEYAGDYPDRGGPSQFLNSGGTYRLMQNQQIDFRAGVGLNHNAPDYVVGIGYSFRLDGVASR
jgi:hypothetical protein